jgi:hypothetical protein
VNLNPREQEAWRCLGRAFRDAGWHPDSLRCLIHAVSLNPKDALAWKELAATERHMGRDRDADLHISIGSQLQ